MKYQHHILTAKSCTLIFTDKVVQVTSGNKMYGQIAKLIGERKFEDVEDLAYSFHNRVTKKSDGRIVYKKGKYIIGKKEVPESIAQIVRKFTASGINLDPIVNFWMNLLKNPDVEAQKDLYDFLKHNGIAITEDGCFMAYKRIREDWYDIHSRTILNKPGCRPKLERSLCNSNRNETCSSGLHIAAWGYLNTMGNGDRYRTVMCKVNPKDVVSVPVDYNQQKMRCCEYLVVCEVGKECEDVITNVDEVHAENDMKVSTDGKRVYIPSKYLKIARFMVGDKVYCRNIGKLISITTKKTKDSTPYVVSTDLSIKISVRFFGDADIKTKKINADRKIINIE